MGSWYQRRGQRQKALGIATAETAVAGVFSAFTLGPLLTGFLLAWGTTDFQLGVFAAIPYCVAFTELVAAYCIDLWPGRRKAFVVLTGLAARMIFFLASGLAWCAGYAATWFLPLFLGLYVLFQAFYHASGPGWVAWMAVLVPGRVRGRYLGVRNRIIDATGLLALVAAGWMLDAFRAVGLERQGFSVLHLLAGVSGLVCFCLLSRQYDPGHTSRGAQATWAYLLAALKDTRFRALASINLLWLAGVTVFMPFAEAHVMKNMHWSFKGISMLIIASTLASVLASPFWGRLSDRIGAKQVMGLCMAGLLCAPLLLALCPRDHVLLVYGCWGGIGLFTSGYALTLFGLTLECLPPDGRAMGSALLATLAGPVVAVAGLLAGWGAELAGGYGVLFVASIAIRLPAFLFLKKL